MTESHSCPECSNFDVDRQRVGNGVWVFTCDNSSKHASKAPVSWDTSNAPVRPGGGTGNELDQFTSDLLACIAPGGEFLEFSIVEWRYRARAKDQFEKLVKAGGHVLLNPNDKPDETASKVLVRALSYLQTGGHLVSTRLAATAPWLNQSEVNFWARPPEPLKVNRITWAAYAAANGLTDEQILIGPTSTEDVLP